MNVDMLETARQGLIKIKSVLNQGVQYPHNRTAYTKEQQDDLHFYCSEVLVLLFMLQETEFEGE